MSTSCGFRSTAAGFAWRRAPSLHVLSFMTSTVTDLVVPSTDIIFDKNTKYKIQEASFSDLASIVSLRVNVFYPELKSVVRYVKSTYIPPSTVTPSHCFPVHGDHFLISFSLNGSLIYCSFFLLWIVFIPEFWIKCEEGIVKDLFV